FFDAELWDLAMWGWDDFLVANGDPALHRLADVDGPRIFPPPPGALPDRYTGFDLDLAEYVTRARAHGVTPLEQIEHLAEGVRGLEETRRVDLEDWMRRLALDAILFPAVADVGRADMDVNVDSADAGWRNGVWVANGNLAIRHLGIPTVTIPLGTMTDTRMPVGLTILGPAYSDSFLLRVACAIEGLGSRRTSPPLAPPLARTRESL
ncbi:MAG: amidase family protein, partial [Actinomycetota bacterium]|nr:amidase family protein [Actinomycetota bacterium]